MKHRNISIIGVILALALVLVACSQEEKLTSSQEAVKIQNGYYVYKIDFNCETPGYDQNTTRAVSYNWQKGETLFARFKSGSTYYLGFIVCEGTAGWNFISTTAFIKSNNTGTCELYFFRDNDSYLYPNLETEKFDIYSNGVYVSGSDIALDAETITLSEGTAFYYTSTGSYTSMADGNWGVTATLSPALWRMRFSGTNGTTITLPAINNDIQYCSRFNWTFNSPSTQPTVSLAAKDISLTASGGYTPYVYGIFNNETSSNKITVKNGNNTYSRDFNASNLQVGTSGYFDIPTESNYSSNGWTKENSQSSLLCEEPYIKWGASKATVKSNRASNGYTIWFEEDNGLYYESKYKEKYTSYLFNPDTGGLYISYAAFDSSTISFTELVEYVRTTLGAIYDYTADSGTVWFNAKDGKSCIFVIKYSDGDVGLNYTQPYSNSPAFMSNRHGSAKMDGHMEQVCSEIAQQAVKEHPEVLDWKHKIEENVRLLHNQLTGIK